MAGDASSGLQTPWPGVQESKTSTAAVAASIFLKLHPANEPQRAMSLFVACNGEADLRHASLQDFREDEEKRFWRNQGFDSALQQALVLS